MCVVRLINYTEVVALVRWGRETLESTPRYGHVEKWETMKSLELFTGGGGLALGIERAGFRHAALVEYDHDSCATLRANSGGASIKHTWPVYETDVRQFYYERWAGKVNLLAGGPPCQPFSIGGKHLGDTDHRNMFPEVFRAARALRPQAILVENVRGLTRETFRPYLEYILLQLRFPTIVPRNGEEWTAHKERLQRIQDGGVKPELEYRVTAPTVLNLVDYGVPQQRHRLIIVAVRADLDVEWTWPQPTHSRDALLYDQWVTGAYWKRHSLQQPQMPPSLEATVRRLRAGSRPTAKPWRTVRDALVDLPEPVDGEEHPTIPNHVGIPGARSYYGHSGSPYDWPAKTLKAGGHGVPGGENMLLRDDGTVRYFTVRESARLQTFPDTYVFASSRTESMRQIGNAVPVEVATMLARELHALLAKVNRAQVSRTKRTSYSSLSLLEAVGT